MRGGIIGIDWAGWVVDIFKVLRAMRYEVYEISQSPIVVLWIVVRCI